MADDNRAAWWDDGTSTPVPPVPGPTGTGVGPVAASCATRSLCAVAEGNGSFPVYDGRTWKNDEVIDPENSPTDVACLSSGRCLGVDDGGQVLSYEGSWSRGFSVDKGGSFASLSCPSSSFCLAVTSDMPPRVFEFNGASWRPVTAPAPSTPQGGSEPNVLDDVACTSPRWCVAVDNFGELFIWNGSRWSSPSRFGQLEDLSARVSCGGTSLCMVVDEGGGATAVVGGRVATRRMVTSGRSALTAVSCPSARTCVAVATDGRVYTFRLAHG